MQKFNRDTSATLSAAFQTILENVKDYAIFSMDLNGIINTWNLGVQTVLGYAEDEFIGRHVSMIFTVEDVVQHEPENEMERAARDGRTEDERWHVHRSGIYFW